MNPNWYSDPAGLRERADEFIVKADAAKARGQIGISNGHLGRANALLHRAKHIEMERRVAEFNR